MREGGCFDYAEPQGIIMLKSITRNGFSLVGLLMVLVIMVILMSISFTSMNKTMTGEGSAKELTVRSMEDKLNLYALAQSLMVEAMNEGGRFPVPSAIAAKGPGDEEWDGSGRGNRRGGRGEPEGDVSLNTTANLFSVLVMKRLINPEQLISGNEFSGYVEPYEHYNYGAYRPGEGVFWDPGFRADLAYLSHTSFAHVPLRGERWRKYWLAHGSSRFPILGNRGPKDGVLEPNSYTIGRNGEWGGHLVFADGHIEFQATTEMSGLNYTQEGTMIPDNLFRMEKGSDGTDAILSFTKAMKREGVELQFD